MRLADLANLPGYLVLACRSQLEDRQWWQELPLPIAIVVDATGRDNKRGPFRYPPEHQCQKLAVPVYWSDGRQARLEQALPAVLKALSENKAVAPHCNETYHRGPVLAAIILSQYCQIPYWDAVWHISKYRYIDIGHTDPRWCELRWRSHLGLSECSRYPSYFRR